LQLAGLLILLLAALLTSLAGPAARINSPSSLGSTLSAADAIADLLISPRFAIGDEQLDGAALSRFYRMRDSRLAWSGNPKADSDAKAAVEALSNARANGLEDSKYHLNAISKLQPNVGAYDAAVRDLLMTDAILRYARDLRTGRVAPNAADGDVNLCVQTFDAVSALETALQSGLLVQFLTPPHPQYSLLKSRFSGKPQE
jgi:murein L,D-transpeptidase YcbB/YkuD